MGNRSLVFPEFVLRKKDFIGSTDKPIKPRFIRTEHFRCHTTDNPSPISVSVFVLITEVKAASLIQDLNTELMLMRVNVTTNAG